MFNKRWLFNLLGIKSYNPNNKYWFRDIVKDSQYNNRLAQVLKIKDYLLRKHDVLMRKDFEFKEETFITSKAVLNIIQSVLNTHISYLIGNPISFNGNPEVVKTYNRVYKRGHFNKTDYEIVKDLYTFGNAFEYIYRDPIDDNIKSHVIANQDAIPIYDDCGRYTSFIEYWHDGISTDEHYVVYFPDRVETYVNENLVDTKTNTGYLPIHYCSLNKSANRNFGEPFINDLIPIVDTIEDLVSSMIDGVKVFSLNPLLVVTGKQIKSNIPVGIAGIILNLEDGCDAKPLTNEIDHQSVKLALDTLWQQFYAIACIPAAHMGQVNVTNVSETSLRLLYSKLDDKAKEMTIALREGLYKRYDIIRDLLLQNDINISDDDYDTLDMNFNVNRPVDTYSLMEELFIQWQMGAISTQTIVDQSPYTIDTANEMKRLEEEHRNEMLVEDRGNKTIPKRRTQVNPETKSSTTAE